jgi:hypothetical protein
VPDFRTRGRHARNLRRPHRRSPPEIRAADRHDALPRRRFPKSLPKRGVYLFSEGDAHLYVGRSNKIRARWGRHCNPGATHRMAAFALKLARETTGKLTASYEDDETAART